jgi:hypothetical protein
VLFTTGAAGDINPEHMGDFAYAEELGQALAAEALRILGTLEFRDHAALDVTREMLDLPLNPPPGIDELKRMIIGYRQCLAEAESAGAVLAAKMQRAILGWAESTLSAAKRETVPAYVPVEIQLISLGRAALLGIPGEIFSALGREIKNSVSPRQALVLGYTNNDIGYIPTRQAYALGGYEIDDAYKFYGYPAVLAPQAGELVLRTAARLLGGVLKKPGTDIFDDSGE